jgi:hypothetical protein
MVFAPRRTALLVRHFLLLVLLIPLIALSALRLLRYPPDVLGAIGFILLIAALAALPAVMSRFILLVRVQYKLVPGGGLEVGFGQRFERIPVEAIEEIRSGANIPASWREKAPTWWNSWSGRTSPSDSEKPVDWLATNHDANLLFLMLPDRAVAISPADPETFLQAFSEWATHGGMEKVEPLSAEPDPFFMDIFDHAAAASLIGFGLAEVAFLGAFIIGIQPTLSPQMPFKFNVAGLPVAPGDPFRLFILPIAGAIVWLINGGLGWFGWRMEEYTAAYILWGASTVVGIGLWFATIVLLVNR